jgi:hypothetical protein
VGLLKKLRLKDIPIGTRVVVYDSMECKVVGHNPGPKGLGDRVDVVTLKGKHRGPIGVPIRRVKKMIS